MTSICHQVVWPAPATRWHDQHMCFLCIMSSRISSMTLWPGPLLTNSSTMTDSARTWSHDPVIMGQLLTNSTTMTDTARTLTMTRCYGVHYWPSLPHLLIGHDFACHVKMITVGCILYITFTFYEECTCRKKKTTPLKCNDGCLKYLFNIRGHHSCVLCSH